MLEESDGVKIAISRAKCNGFACHIWDVEERFDSFHQRQNKYLEDNEMKLREACEIAEGAGLRTVGEAVLNIEMHAGMFWSYENMVEELNELVKEADQYSDDTSIFYVLEDEG